MTILAAECPQCHQTRNSLFDRRTFHEHIITNRLCDNCGLVFQSPHMSDEELASFYEQEYRKLYQGDQGPNPKDLWVQDGRAQALVEFSQGSINTIGRHLDIGCSAGNLLQAFQISYQCQSEGIEPGTAYRNHAAAQGLLIYPSLKDLEEQQEESFDLVSLAHVLEHIPDPVKYLTHLRSRLIHPTGWLLVEVPNLYGHDCFELAHMVSYSYQTLEQVLKQAGFRAVKSRIHGKPRSEILPLYITILAQPDSTTIQALPQRERRVRWKRKIGMIKCQVQTRLNPQKAWIPLSDKQSS